MKSVYTLVLLIISIHLNAQDWKSLNGDDLFALARKTAFDGDHDQARQMLRRVLEQYSNYNEVRVFLARTYYWDQQLDSVRNELQKVLSMDPENIDALELSIDVELSDKKYGTAIEYADRGLSLSPASERFLIGKARALVNVNRTDEAGVILARIIAINPSNAEALKLTAEIRSASLRNTIGIQYGLDVFNRTYRPANYLALQYARVSGWGTGILRLNYANRFSINGLQGEIDLYPRIARGVYGYLNYGYSTNELFPMHRVGGELYSKLLRSFEGSVGVRYLSFENTGNTIIYTGSLNLYYKNYMFSFRPFLTHFESTSAFSTTLNMRRYLRDGDNFLGIIGGVGFSPDERKLQSTSGLSSDAVYKLKAQRLAIAWQATVRGNFITFLNVGFVRQELSFSLGNYVWITNFSIAIRKRS